MLEPNYNISHLLSSLCLDPHSHWLPDRGVRGRLQSQSAEGGSAGGDGAMGRHPHGPPCVGTQPQDLGFPQRAARVGSLFFAFTAEVSVQEYRAAFILLFLLQYKL